MPYPPYSPDLALSDFLFVCFPRWKKVLKGKHFANVEEVQQKMAEAPKSVKIHEFQNCFQQWGKKSQ